MKNRLLEDKNASKSEKHAVHWSKFDVKHTNSQALVFTDNANLELRETRFCSLEISGGSSDLIICQSPRLDNCQFFEPLTRNTKLLVGQFTNFESERSSNGNHLWHSLKTPVQYKNSEVSDTTIHLKCFELAS